MDKLHEMVKTSLFQFVNQHIKAADLSVVDEIVLNYVIAALEEATDDPNFDVDGEMQLFKTRFTEPSLDIFLHIFVSVFHLSVFARNCLMLRLFF